MEVYMKNQSLFDDPNIFSIHSANKETTDDTKRKDLEKKRVRILPDMTKIPNVHDDTNDEEDDEEIDYAEYMKEKRRKKAEKKARKAAAKAEKKQEEENDPEKQRQKSEKEERKRQQRKRECEIEMIQLIARRDMLERKLNELDPGDPKDSRVIAAINIELINIRDELERLSKESGIPISSLNTGTRFGRFMNKVKEKGKRIVKKVKKFYKRNKELIVGIASIVLPFVVSLGVRTIFGL